MAPNLLGPLEPGLMNGSPLTAAFDARGLGSPDFAIFWDYVPPDE